MLKLTQFDEITRIDSARTIGGRGRYWTTAYYIDGLLIDTGCPHSADEMADYITGQPLAQIVNSHSHEDHIGANGVLQAQVTGLKISAHHLALPILANPRQQQPLNPYRRIMWGWPQPSQAAPLADGDWIETEQHRFQVIHTPGHSPDHICLYELARGWLFSGDLFVGGRDQALRVDYDIWQIIASLKRVAQLPLTTLYPGSARVRQNPSQELADKITYLKEMGEKVIELHQKGHNRADIARRLFGRPKWIEYFTLGHFSRAGLVNSYLQGKKGNPERR